MTRDEVLRIRRHDRNAVIVVDPAIVLAVFLGLTLAVLIAVPADPGPAVAPSTPRAEGAGLALP